MVQKVFLQKGMLALVDDADFDLVAQHNWHAIRSRNTFYAMTHIFKDDGQRTTMRMHKLITGYVQTDHINGNGLDNRRENLRSAGTAQNQANQKKSWGSSQYKGVSWSRQHGKWKAYIGVNHQKLYLGLFLNEDDAARAYDESAVSHWGEFAQLNFPKGF